MHELNPLWIPKKIATDLCNFFFYTILKEHTSENIPDL